MCKISISVDDVSSNIDFDYYHFLSEQLEAGIVPDSLDAKRLYLLLNSLAVAGVDKRKRDRAYKHYKRKKKGVFPQARRPSEAEKRWISEDLAITKLMVEQGLKPEIAIKKRADEIGEQKRLASYRTSIMKSRGKVNKEVKQVLGTEFRHQFPEQLKNLSQDGEKVLDEAFAEIASLVSKRKRLSVCGGRPFNELDPEFDDELYPDEDDILLVIGDKTNSDFEQLLNSPDYPPALKFGKIFRAR